MLFNYLKGTSENLYANRHEYGINMKVRQRSFFGEESRKVTAVSLRYGVFFALQYGVKGMFFGAFFH